ncbi:hypothetical protein R3P38DRAFT_2771792 [Favolaschia claudopus]|uniref:Uncharacterized protein n=1 Tax=Favolaschia claudopus TaxID=2862362 RepID=A0AAW0CFD4_9AGAR
MTKRHAEEGRRVDGAFCDADAVEVAPRDDVTPTKMVAMGSGGGDGEQVLVLKVSGVAWWSSEARDLRSRCASFRTVIASMPSNAPHGRSSDSLPVDRVSKVKLLSAAGAEAVCGYRDSKLCHRKQSPHAPHQNEIQGLVARYCGCSMRGGDGVRPMESASCLRRQMEDVEKDAGRSCVASLFSRPANIVPLFTRIIDLSEEGCGWMDEQPPRVASSSSQHLRHPLGGGKTDPFHPTCYFTPTPYTVGRIILNSACPTSKRANTDSFRIGASACN